MLCWSDAKEDNGVAFTGSKKAILATGRVYKIQGRLIIVIL